ncbi:orotidine-5'-phosphate decarboxylase [Planifilum fulgidum]|jgi:orotidine-5'-phosphate decarboxylase|uniref:Orotidine 5'-phosphate decarboxylase n=1 Tax=Planifilum fulgidum TaxID=201973 RepID=A0A1I2R8C8_9BACL|nr:orotidine-5'-phosphate decarboxylase [Planifilum fulgidum]SFG34151.1 orotidine-5'-phosphate decarboxylase [Planifilum fulgidum]
MRGRVVIALDFPTAEEAEALLSRLEAEEKPFVKVGMQLFYAAGPRWVERLKERGCDVFLDLKLHDIPNTVAGAVDSVARLGVDLLTLHACGGRAMMEAAREARDRSGASSLRLVAVTQLTSLDQRVLNEELGIPGTVEACVSRYARMARESGMDGAVCSGWEVEGIKAMGGPDFLAVVPGIRPKGEAAQDQKRVMTPQEAAARGADLLVVGRPITRAADPAAAYRAIVRAVQNAGRDRCGLEC